MASGFQPVPAGSADAFMTEVGSTGNSLLSSSYLGGAGNDRGQGVAVDTDGMIHTVGSLVRPACALYASRIGSQDAFVRRYSAQAAKSAPWGDAWATIWLVGSLAALVFVRSRKGSVRTQSVA